MDTPPASGDAPAPQLRPVGYRLLAISLILLNVAVLLASTVVVYAKFSPRPSHTTGASVPYAALQKQNTASYQAKVGEQAAEEPQGVKLKTYTSKHAGVQFEYPETWTVKWDEGGGVTIESPPLSARLHYADAPEKSIVRAVINYYKGSDIQHCYPIYNFIGSGSQLFTRQAPLHGETKDSLTRIAFKLRNKDDTYVQGQYAFSCLMSTYGYEFRKGSEVKVDNASVVTEPANMQKVIQKTKMWALDAGFQAPGPRQAAGYAMVAEDVNALPEYEQMKQIMMSFRSVN